MPSDLHIHIPTLMLALLSGYALLGVQLWIVQCSRLRYLNLGLWSWGSWALLGGFTMLAARVLLPTWVSALAGNGLIALGIAIYNEALFRHVLDRPMPRWLWAGPVLAWVLTVWMLAWPLAARTSVISLVYALLLVPCLVVLLGPGWRAETSLRCVTLSLLAAALALVLRCAHAWLNPEDYQDIMQSSLGQGMTFLVSFLCLMGAGFGFVLANFERTARRMEDLASVDGLTGCVNRSTTDVLLAHALERGRREGSPVAFALLDLDHFKDVNDGHGHRGGDAALRAFAAEVRQRLRASDVVGRMGGEEFGLVLPATDAPGALRLVEQVREAVAQLQLRDEQGLPISLTVSAGIAVAAPDAQITGDQLFALADAAMYCAKHDGRNCVRLHEGPRGG